MEHFDTIVIAVATLMEPLLASLIAYACNAGLLVRYISEILMQRKTLDANERFTFSLAHLVGWEIF